MVGSSTKKGCLEHAREPGDGIDGQMLSKETVKGNYVYDYTIQQKGAPQAGALHAQHHPAG